MKKGLVLLGSASGLIGALICLVSGVARVSGMYYVLGYQSTTLFTAGLGIMVFACLLKLEELAAPLRE